MQTNQKAIMGILIAVLLCVIVYGAMTRPDTRSPGEKIGDAVGKLDEGIDDAARELKDRTPAERLGDEIKDATDANSR